MEQKFIDQVELMLQCLPIVMEYDIFALKGGTAINFFYRNMPRLSVDIDLTNRTKTLRSVISDQVHQIALNVEK
jgi:hypothetical protein